MFSGELGKVRGCQMRSVADYLAKAAEFDKLTAEATNASLKKRYADLAECYRLLAADRKKLIDEHVIDSDKPPNSN
jgi:hypothetical protein